MSAATPGVSVIIQSHNRPRGLERVLLSLQMQTLRDFEVVVSDDSSERAKIEAVVAGPAAAGLDIDIRYTPPCGAAESMREAFGRTSRKYVKIVHDDDWLTPHSLECQSRALDENADVNAVYGRAIACYPDGDRLLYAFDDRRIKMRSALWVAEYGKNGLGPIQTPVAALFRRHDRFRIVWDEYVNPVLRESARRTGAGTDINLQVDNAGSNAFVVVLPQVVCFLGTDMDSCTQVDPDIQTYYRLWKEEYDSHPAWRY